MNQEKKDFLILQKPPARLNAQEAAWYLGFATHDIPILVAAGLLKPLGHPPRASTKYFASATLEQLRSDLKWLARASDAIVRHWQKKNGNTLWDESRFERPPNLANGGSSCHRPPVKPEA